MPETHAPTATRQDTVARLHDIATDYASGYREGLTREAALTELAEACADPDLLAEAAAAHAVADNWYAIAAVDLLLAARRRPAPDRPPRGRPRPTARMRRISPFPRVRLTWPS